MARKRPAPKSLERVVEEGATWTHLSFRSGGLRSNGRIALMGERCASRTIPRDRLWNGSLRQTHRRKPSDDSEKAETADRAGRFLRWFIDGGIWDHGYVEQAPAVGQVNFAASVGEPAEVPDLYKPR